MSEHQDRAIGAMLGSAVGDALGAPFEHGPEGKYAEAFPTGEGEMLGGGAYGWAPGEWTDDTQMALLLAASLLDYGYLNGRDVFARFQKWVEARPPDVGSQTRSVLTNGLPWDQAAKYYIESHRHADGNGSLMRSVPGALFFAGTNSTATMGSLQSGLTHGPGADEGVALYHLLIQAALAGKDPMEGLAGVQLSTHYAHVLSPSWDPAERRWPSGAVWPTLGCAVWALRRTDNFADAMREVINLGGDTDTVACVTGGLVGAVYGVDGIPERWYKALNGRSPGHAPVATDYQDLADLALKLAI